MSEFQYKAGLHNVGSYQISGIPYVTASLTAPANTNTPLEIVFPSVTQKIFVHNNQANDKPIRIGFSSNGVKGKNYYLIEAHQANGKSNDRIELRVKTDRIYILSDDSTSVTDIFVAAELTGIKLDYNLASVYSGSAGIG
jgi:hypothetical protein